MDQFCKHIDNYSSRPKVSTHQRLPSIRDGFPAFNNDLEFLELDIHNRSLNDRTQCPTTISHDTASNKCCSNIWLQHQAPRGSSCNGQESPGWHIGGPNNATSQQGIVFRRPSQDSTSSSNSSRGIAGHGLVTPPPTRHCSPAISHLRINNNADDNNADEGFEQAKSRTDAVTRQTCKSQASHMLTEQRRRIETGRMATAVKKEYDPKHIELCQEHGGTIGSSRQNDGQPAKMAVLFFAYCREKYVVQGGHVKILDEKLDITMIKAAVVDWEENIRPDAQEVEEHAKQNAIRKAIKKQHPDAPKLSKRSKVTAVGKSSNKRSRR